jgi:hypothetical protein
LGRIVRGRIVLTPENFIDCRRCYRDRWENTYYGWSEVIVQYQCDEKFGGYRELQVSRRLKNGGKF